MIQQISACIYDCDLSLVWVFAQLFSSRTSDPQSAMTEQIHYGLLVRELRNFSNVRAPRTKHNSGSYRTCCLIPIFYLVKIKIAISKAQDIMFI